jgi:hypothetical protein
MIQVQYTHVWEHHNETPYFIQLICTNFKRKKKIIKNRLTMSYLFMYFGGTEA